jgi:nucleoside-diphosphate kinase
MIKPDAFSNLGHIVQAIEEDGFLIASLKMTQFTRNQAETFYAEHRGKPFFEGLIQFMTSGPVIGLELVQENAIRRWRALLGPTNTQTAKEQAPNSLRARFGTNGTKNACHGSDSSKYQLKFNIFDFINFINF